ncbi:hypothetical protein H6G20_01875 [Desertifilum sp. FACHB-1129]|uniref:Uncharacterized protein n=2 Tax=Cyanophyceae TaxID=3028117 RepID=A0A1E5QFI1_9CYAN|nr:MULTISPECIES: hypothetical protein [Cyanophyceae]MCD8486034.1 hypothetical protein [Desertifilum sp.]MDA0208939.1 hypothetical protein [Cyanobacteria bacterium FC1]MDI9637148.1 hypothetical protein [Geitlerinema splendidum]MDK3159745.1 hypothetical protein [Kamptonema cortianum]MBD2310422.1 hypothetical protein [Desertifilum sp. FACHB-1129]
MQLEFVPVEEFYFALTLAVKPLEEIDRPGLVEQVRSRLHAELGQPSTVAAAAHNTFNYVFRVPDVENTPAPRLIVSVLDWHDKLRISSDYGWALDAERKPTRTLLFEQRADFAQVLRSHLQDWWQIPLIQ